MAPRLAPSGTLAPVAVTQGASGAAPRISPRPIPQPTRRPPWSTTRSPRPAQELTGRLMGGRDGVRALTGPPLVGRDGPVGVAGHRQAPSAAYGKVAAMGGRGHLQVGVSCGRRGRAAVPNPGRGVGQQLGTTLISAVRRAQKLSTSVRREQSRSSALAYIPIDTASLPAALATIQLSRARTKTGAVVFCSSSSSKSR